jgi:hypothetical protein
MVLWNSDQSPGEHEQESQINSNEQRYEPFLHGVEMTPVILEPLPVAPFFPRL